MQDFQISKQSFNVNAFHNSFNKIHLINKKIQTKFGEYYHAYDQSFSRSFEVKYF